MKNSQDGKPLVVAHRGLHSDGITENTMEAFEAAVSAGAEMIELDVRRSGSGELVVLHDHKLKNVVLDSCSLDDFAARTGFRPPLLTEVLDWAKGRVALDVELKEDGYVEELGELLGSFHDDGGQLIVTSFIPELLIALGQVAPQLETGLLLMFTADNAAARTRAAGAAITLPEMKLLSEQLIESIAADGLDLIVWDYMAAKQGPKLMNDVRIRAVITDDVPGALSARS